MTKEKNELVELSIPPLTDYIGVVRLAISGIATRMNFSIDDIEDIKIAVSEACTNAVQYAYNKEEASETIKISCKISNDRLSITVKDSGKGFDVDAIEKQRKDGNLPLTDDENGANLGLGMTFIKNLMDKAEISSKIGVGTTVLMEKRTP